MGIIEIHEISQSFQPVCKLASANRHLSRVLKHFFNPSSRYLDAPLLLTHFGSKITFPSPDLSTSCSVLTKIINENSFALPSTSSCLIYENVLKRITFLATLLRWLVFSYFFFSFFLFYCYYYTYRTFADQQ